MLIGWAPHVGAVVYELVSGKQLFPVGSSVTEYQSKLASMHTMEFPGCPPQLLSTLRAMLSTQPSARPNANAFAGAPYFQVSPFPAQGRFCRQHNCFSVMFP